MVKLGVVAWVLGLGLGSCAVAFAAPEVANPIPKRGTKRRFSADGERRTEKKKSRKGGKGKKREKYFVRQSKDSNDGREEDESPANDKASELKPRRQCRNTHQGFISQRFTGTIATPFLVPITQEDITPEFKLAAFDFFQMEFGFNFDFNETGVQLDESGFVLTPLMITPELTYRVIAYDVRSRARKGGIPRRRSKVQVGDSFVKEHLFLVTAASGENATTPNGLTVPAGNSMFFGRYVLMTDVPGSEEGEYLTEFWFHPSPGESWATNSGTIYNDIVHPSSGVKGRAIGYVHMQQAARKKKKVRYENTVSIFLSDRAKNGCDFVRSK